jgi:hypothetical protein
MSKIYTVYYLHEETNELGNPYVGCTINVFKRTTEHRHRLKLNHRPKLETIGIFDNFREARDYEYAEQKRLGWENELSKCSKSGQIGGNKHVESGHLASIRTKEHQSKAGKLGIRSNSHPNNMSVICYHCGKSGKARIMKRWHFDNCKYKTNERTD